MSKKEIRKRYKLSRREAAVVSGAVSSNRLKCEQYLYSVSKFVTIHLCGHSAKRRKEVRSAIMLLLPPVNI